MTKIIAVLLFLSFQFDIYSQTCKECECCKGITACDRDKNCLNGCIAGYRGDKCTEPCLENCKTCVSEWNCTECHPGYYTAQCAFECGKGCVNNTCLQSGECTCKSDYFIEGICNICANNTYGDECNNTCPSNCGACQTRTECRWCKNNTFYGSYCQFMCSVGCAKGKCYTDGMCIAGCKSGFTGNKCDSCVSGKHGPECDLNCLGNCNSCLSNSSCTECKLGLYGETCRNICSPGCYGVCSITSGQCIKCKHELYGDYCNETCEEGFYGNNCLKICKNIDVNCQKCLTNESGIYGGCINCISGYYPFLSNDISFSLCTACPEKCKDNTCNTTGYRTFGCAHGKWGSTCESDCKFNCLECNQNDGKCIKCNNGKYSEDCSKSCSMNCRSVDSERICELHTGECISGCNSYRKYGNYCEHNCSETCNNQTCNWKTGHCSFGCIKNYHGSFCENTCASTCKSEEEKRSCNESAGFCIFGCEDGFYGNMCESKCSGTCVNETCHQVTAECLYGCIDGYDGLQCTQATKQIQQDGITAGELIGIVFGSVLVGIVIGGTFTVAFIIWKRRKRGENNQQKDVTYENNIPVTYEDLKERDERKYSEIAANR